MITSNYLPKNEVYVMKHTTRFNLFNTVRNVLAVIGAVYSCALVAVIVKGMLGL